MEIRRFATTDRERLLELFKAVSDGSPVASLWGHPESEADVYLVPYMDAEPESVFVADDGGQLVGYLVGSVSDENLPSESARMEQAMKRHKLFYRPQAVQFFLRASMDMLGAQLRRRPMADDFSDARWPAHLHIDVTPQARGTGAAQRLMEAFLAHLDEAGVQGCHLQTQLENVRAVRFFRRFGFVPFGESLPIAGVRYQWQRLHQLTMVRPIA